MPARHSSWRCYRTRSPPSLAMDGGGCTLGRGASCHVVVPHSVVSACTRCCGARGCALSAARPRQRQRHLRQRSAGARAVRASSDDDLIGLGDKRAQLAFADPDSTSATASQTALRPAHDALLPESAGAQADSKSVSACCAICIASAARSARASNARRRCGGPVLFLAWK